MCFSSSNVTVALFSADWADQCQQILDVMNELSKNSSLQFVNIPAEDLSEISIQHQIEAVPTVLFFRSGSAIDRIDGVNIVEFTTKCKSLTGLTTKVPESKESLEERLKVLINKGNVTIFMKGDRNTPRCGFSKTLIGIMNETGFV